MACTPVHAIQDHSVGRLRQLVERTIDQHRSQSFVSVPEGYGKVASVPKARFELVLHEVQYLKELAAAQVPGVEAQQMDEGVGDHALRRQFRGQPRHVLLK